MEKDLKSYEKHDSEYRDSNINNVEIIKKLYEKYDNEDQFGTTGLRRSIEEIKNLPKIHIDVGSGGGWLLRKTSPLFERVIGIEPSTDGVKFASTILKDHFSFTNIEFINMEMVDGMKEFINNNNSANPTQPAYVTTSIVLSHIEDAYVSAFLQQLNRIPNNSVLFFDERYGKNIHRTLWHIRSKNWWAKNLSDWQLSFYELNNSGYKSGIYGVKVGKSNVTDTFIMNSFEQFLWSLEGLTYSLVNGLKSAIKTLVKKPATKK